MLKIYTLEELGYIIDNDFENIDGGQTILYVDSSSETHSGDYTEYLYLNSSGNVELGDGCLMNDILYAAIGYEMIRRGWWKYE